MQLHDFKALYWFDYCTLRQCQNDFKVPWVFSVIEQIGSTVVEIDDKYAHNAYLGWQNFTMTFCVLETFASVWKKAELVFMLSEDEKINQRVVELKISSKDASTRSEKHKTMIDNYIEQEIGFEQFDSLVSDSVNKAQYAHIGGEDRV